MNYTQTIDYIHSIPKFSRPLGNAALRSLLAALGDPHKRLKYIHIAGTNGKGSAAAMISNILIKAGYKTGMFTSPYIERFNERIQINNEHIPDCELARIATQVRRCMEDNNTFVSEFAFDTAVMFVYFAEQGCDYAVLEVGLGGLLDATNVIEASEVSVITSISLDHMQYLGDTVSEIAKEKCGIIKEHGRVVLYPVQEKEVFETVRRECEKKGAELIIAAAPVPLGDGTFMLAPAQPGAMPGAIRSRIALGGVFQPYNAAAAVEAVRCMARRGARITEENIRCGLTDVKWPARFERIGEKLIIDGGHNADGALRLADSLKALGSRINIVAAVMSDKAVPEFVKALSPAAASVITTEIAMPRCLPARLLAAEFEKNGVHAESIPNVKAAVDTALSREGITCVCGSLYLAGEVRRLITHKAPGGTPH